MDPKVKGEGGKVTHGDVEEEEEEEGGLNDAASVYPLYFSLSFF